MLKRLRSWAILAHRVLQNKKVQVYTIIGFKVALMYIYTIGILSGSINPTVPSWGIITVAVTVVYSAFVAKQRRLVDPGNVSNTADIVLVWTMFPMVLVWGQGDNMAWKLRDLLCALAAIAVIVYWAKNWTKKGNHTRAHLAMQGVMTLAFLPLFNNLWQADANPESFLYWRLVLFAEAIGVLVARKHESVLPAVYCARATLMALITLALMLRIEFLN